MENGVPAGKPAKVERKWWAAAATAVMGMGFAAMSMCCGGLQSPGGTTDTHSTGSTLECIAAMERATAPGMPLLERVVAMARAAAACTGAGRDGLRALCQSNVLPSHCDLCEAAVVQELQEQGRPEDAAAKLRKLDAGPVQRE